jgi:riboflavin kinase/FMN adenylyltransferase
MERMRHVDPFFGRTGLTIGNFEGFHIGHRKIINTLAARSRSSGLYVGAITFKEHPLKVIRGFEPERLTLPHEKLVNLRSAGIDLLFYLEFSSAFAETGPEKFVQLLHGLLAPRLLCLGKGFRFGRDNLGDIDFLKKRASKYGYEVVVVEDVLYDGATVSSTRIRAAVKRGDFDLANALLGRPYHLYVILPPGELLLQPLCENCAFPASGTYDGELCSVYGGERRGVVIERASRGFKIIRGLEPDVDCLYRLSFLGQLKVF